MNAQWPTDITEMDPIGRRRALERESRLANERSRQQQGSFMDELVIEKLANNKASAENGNNTQIPQTDILKILAAGGGGSNPLGGGLQGGMGLSGIGSLAAAAQARQNGGNMMRSYEALLQSSSAAARMPVQPVTLPGPTRRRKKKRRRQPDMPKKACTPFMHFCAYFKRKLMEEGKEFPQFADFGKRAGELWRNMGEAEKSKFNELSEQDRQRYIKDMKEYEERKLAEKERERELQQQREKELQALREKELERLQKQQREQMEQQQKHLEQQAKHQQPAPNAALLNMMNPLNPLSPLMIAALNQSLMQTVLTNPDLMKTMYSEAAKNYYAETLKNIYQNMGSPQTNGSSSPVTSSAGSILSSMGSTNDIPSSMPSNPLAAMALNMNSNLPNILSLLNNPLSNHITSTSTTLSNSGSLSPLSKMSTPPHHGSPLGSTNSLVAAALDLSSARSHDLKTSISSDEDPDKDGDCDV